MRTASQIVLLALVAVFTPELAAQEGRPGIRVAESGARSGFWGVFTIGAGVEQVKFENDPLGFSDPLTRPVVDIRLGGTLSPHWRLGGELSSWINSDNGLTETVSGAMLITQLYPWERRGLFLKAGAGLGQSAIEDDFGELGKDTGFVGALGVGWDIRLGRRVFLVPTVDVSTYALGAGDTQYQERITTFGLGIAYQR